MEELSWRWLAGFVDADGSFTIGLRVRNRADGSINMTFAPVINVRQKNSDAGLTLIERIAEFVGCGRIYTGNRSDGTSSATWQTTNVSEVLSVGSILYPELQLKRDPAKKVLRCAFLIAESQDGYNHNQSKLWELYTLYRDINPEGNWADRKQEFTQEDIVKIASENRRRYVSKENFAYDSLGSLPSDIMSEVVNGVKTNA